MIKKIAILGAGAFGFAIAKMIGDNKSNHNIFLYDVNKEYIDNIKKTRKHPIFHNHVKLPESVTATNSRTKSIKGADIVILAIPSKYLREAIRSFKPYFKKGVIFLNLAKGLELKTNYRVSQIVEEELGSDFDHGMCVLAGGMIAKEVVLQKPVCANLACECRDCAKDIAKMFYTSYFRIETTDDLLGVELTGAFKNVVAIGAGIFDGMKFNESSKSAFISAAAKEMQTLAIKIGARRETFGAGSQAWFGDLMTTCFGESRNREFGELIGRGIKVKDAIKSMEDNHKSVEGYLTTNVVYKLLKQYKVEAPLLTNVYKILYKNEPADDFVKHFIKH